MTTPTRLEWPPGPPAPADGLHAAFRAADRRKARRALATAVPVVVAAALAMTASLQAGGTDSLQLPPAQHVPVTDTDRQLPKAPVVEAPQLAGSVPGQGPAAGTAAGGDVAGDDGGQAQPAATAPARPPKPAPPGSFDLLAQHSARVQVRLAKATHPAFSAAHFTRSGRYAGIWVVDSHGTVVGSALQIAGTSGNPDRKYSESPDVLPAGTYTFYVLGEGRTTAHVPLPSGETGVNKTATRTVAASYLTKAYTMQPIETNVALRLHLPKTSAVGYAGGYIETPGSAASTVDVCLPRRDAKCAAGDPHQNNNSQVTVGGGFSVTLAVTPTLLRQGRDDLLTVQAHGTGSTVMTCWSFTVSLA